MKKKLQKQGGFTLVEMLIVVAIIAILICVSLPMISTNLEKARVATDNANLRSAQSLAHAFYLTNVGTVKENGDVFEFNDSGYYYSVDSSSHEGELVDSSSGLTGYGLAGENKGKVVKVTITETDGEVSIEANWEELNNNSGG